MPNTAGIAHGGISQPRLTRPGTGSIVRRKLRRGCGHMKILVIGGGGREHSLVWKLKQSSRVERIWCAPGNGGIQAEAECIPADPADIAALVAMAERLGPD